MRVTWVRLIAIFCILFCAPGARPCSIAEPVSNVKMVKEADVIVRATAEGYAIPPKKSDPLGNFMPDSIIRFKVIELIRGKLPNDYLLIHGSLVERDDFNDQKSPYTFVRPGGRSGNCVALNYRVGAQFLLLLQKSENDGALTPYWYALGPVNEQLHSSGDPWLLWVRKEADKSSVQAKP